MARFVVPLEDFTKTFEIDFNSQKEIEEFEKNGAIWEYEPFLKYIERFDENYGYSVSVSKSNHLFGKGKTYIYTVHIYDIKE